MNNLLSAYEEELAKNPGAFKTGKVVTRSKGRPPKKNLQENLYWKEF